MSTTGQIRDFFNHRTESAFNVLGKIVGRSPKVELAIYNHGHKILAAVAIGGGFFVIKKVIAPGIAKMVTAAKPHFDKLRNFAEEHRDIITKSVSCLSVGLGVACAFKLIHIALEFSEMDVVLPEFEG